MSALANSVYSSERISASTGTHREVWSIRVFKSCAAPCGPTWRQVGLYIYSMLLEKKNILFNSMNASAKRSFMLDNSTYLLYNKIFHI